MGIIDFFKRFRCWGISHEESMGVPPAMEVTGDQGTVSHGSPRDFARCRAPPKRAIVDMVHDISVKNNIHIYLRMCINITVLLLLMIVYVYIYIYRHTHSRLPYHNYLGKVYSSAFTG